MHQIHTKIDKKVQIIENFMQFLCIFLKPLWLRISQTFNKETSRFPGGFFEEVKAICAGKMHQIYTKIDKKTEKFRFLKILFYFCFFLKP